MPKISGTSSSFSEELYLPVRSQSLVDLYVSFQDDISLPGLHGVDYVDSVVSQDFAHILSCCLHVVAHEQVLAHLKSIFALHEPF